MTDNNKPKLSPKEGTDAIMGLIPDILGATENNDLKSMDSILDQLGSIAEMAGLDMTDIGAQLAGVQGESAKAQRHFENVDAAMWAGDMARVKMLHERGPELDHAAMGVDDYDGIDDDDEMTLSDEEQTANALLAMGIDPTVMVAAEDTIPDRYADIAAGKTGAVDAFIATGQDPNIPTGTDQHTAFLAALDAPARNANDLQRLIDAGADPLLCHAYGDTALSWAMGYRNLDTVTHESEAEIVQLLVDAGIDVNHSMPDFGVPLCRAIVEGTDMQVAAILAAGATLVQNLPDDFPNDVLAGATLIMAAAPKPAVVSLLLAHDVKPNMPDVHQRDPIAFIQDAAIAARARADENDPWTVMHADHLETSLALITAQT